MADGGFSLGVVRTICNFPVAVGAGSANALYGYRVIEGGTITKIRVGVGTTSAGNICVAVYGNSGVGLAARPLNRVATSGTVPCPAANTTADIPLGTSVVVAAGDWLTFGCDSGTATFWATYPGGPTGMSGGMMGWSGSSVPAPATLGVWNDSIQRQVWLLGIP